MTIGLNLSLGLSGQRRANGGGSSLLSGLQSYWSLDEASGSFMDAVGGRTLVPVDGAGYGTGKIAGGSTRTASSRLTNSDALWEAARDMSWTWAFWMKHTNLAGYAANGYAEIVWRGYTFDIGPVENGGSWFVYSNSYQVQPVTGFMATIQSTVDLIENQWQLCIVGQTVSPITTDMHIQIDNNPVDRQSFGRIGHYPTGGGPIPDNLSIGRYDDSGDDYGDGAVGTIDEIGFWNRDLTDTERASLWNGGAGLAYPFA